MNDTELISVITKSVSILENRLTDICDLLKEETVNKVQIINLPLTAGEERDFVMPKTCKWFTLHSRSGAAIRVATESGFTTSSGPYITVKAGSQWDERPLDIKVIKGFKFYCYCATDETLEVVMGVTYSDSELTATGLKVKE